MEEVFRHAISAGVSLLSGYFFIKFSFCRKFAAEHLRTDRYALHILGYSLIFFIFGCFLAEVIPNWTPKLFQPLEHDASTAGLNPAIVNAIALAIVFAWVDNLHVLFVMRDDPAIKNDPNKGFRHQLHLAAVAQFVQHSNDGILRTVFRALVFRKRLMVTLKSRKVYVGEPFVPRWNPSSLFTSLKLIPFASGFRSQRTHRVVLMTQYSELGSSLRLIPGVVRQMLDRQNPLQHDLLHLVMPSGDLKPVDIEDLGIVIAWCEVESITLFDENVYNWFQSRPPISNARPKKKRKPRNTNIADAR